MFEADVSRADFLNDGAVEGELLAHRLARGALPAGEALRYAVEIGALLQRAHARGGVHGALSPHSIAITPDGLRLLRPPALSEPCDAPYRSPEQVRGEAPDERSDIFAFGAVLYEAVLGRRAFSGEGAELDRAILEDFPAPVTDKTALPAALELIVAGCLQKDPLAAHPVDVGLVTATFSRRDTIGASGGCRLKGGQTRVDCREHGVVP